MRNGCAGLREDPALANAFSPDGFPVLGLAAFFGPKKVVDLLLAHGVDPNTVSRNSMRVAPLQGAVANRHTAIAAALLAAGADVSARQQGGWTPLHAAADHGQTDMLELLLGRGADVNARNDGGESALSLALKKGHAPAAELLRRHGAVK